MKPLIIIGAGGFGREVAWLIERINQKSQTWDILGFIDDSPEKHGCVLNGYPVLGGLDNVKDFRHAHFVCAVGNASVRKEIIQKVRDLVPDACFATLIDPSVIMSSSVSIGEGSIVCAGSILTVNINIGSQVHINLDCTVGHDCVLGDFTTLYPSVNLSGGVNIGCMTELGTGSQILQYKTIGSGSIVAAGSVVINDIPDKCMAAGVPALPKKFYK